MEGHTDVLEYKQDNVVDVKTYERLTGYDKNTGLSLDMQDIQHLE